MKRAEWREAGKVNELEIAKQVERVLLAHIFDKCPPLAEIAAGMGLSPTTCKRNFHSVYGEPVHQYYLSQKMQRAKVVLEAENVTVQQTAFRFGYARADGFMRIFKSKFGVFPTAIVAHRRPRAQKKKTRPVAELQKEVADAIIRELANHPLGQYLTIGSLSKKLGISAVILQKDFQAIHKQTIGKFYRAMKELLESGYDTRESAVRAVGLSGGSTTFTG